MNGDGWLARADWSSWFVGGLGALALGVLWRLLSPSRHPSASSRDGIHTSSTDAFSVRNRRTEVRKCMISRQRASWLVELFDGAGDFIGRAESAPFTGSSGPVSFAIYDARGNTVGRCDVTPTRGQLQLRVYDRNSVLVTDRRYSAPNWSTIAAGPRWSTPAGTGRPA